ncbi:MAG TPA: hypothetical protein VKJ77_07760 [Caballeronia sp.]|nr:hypothetical protein [Caballeronia sp.]
MIVFDSMKVKALRSISALCFCMAFFEAVRMFRRARRLLRCTKFGACTYGRGAMKRRIGGRAQFQLSDAAAMISGIVMPIDGGFTAR